MSLNDINKSVSTLVKIRMDFCRNIFGLPPCNATGTNCYNTFATCKDKSNFKKTTKIYKYTDYDLPSQFDAKPYLLDTSYNPTEIKDDKTVNARVKLTLVDEPDSDISIDPYWESRGYANVNSVPGSYWKKWIERNPNYKDKKIEVYEGDTGEDESSYTLKFTGIIEKIKRGFDKIEIECVDLLAKLDDIDYPIVQDIELAEDLPNLHKTFNGNPIMSEDTMLNLGALKNDICLRSDFYDFDVSTNNIVNTGGLEPGRNFTYTIIGYTTFGRPVARSEHPVSLNSGFGIGSWSINITFPTSDPPEVNYYRVYRDGKYAVTFSETVSFLDNGSNITNEGEPPSKAERYFKLEEEPPTDANNWELSDKEFTLKIDDPGGLGAPGYIKLDDEIIYYSGISESILQDICRAQFESEPARHYSGTNVKALLYENPQNPFKLAVDFLNLSGFKDSEIDTAAFSSLESSWSDIDFSAYPIVKETKANKLYFDLMRMVDARSWINEEGKVTINLNSDTLVSKTITDESNIVNESTKVDIPDDQIKTRLFLYWNRYDVQESITDKENFTELNISIDATAESGNMYDNEYKKDYTTIWINSDVADEDTINNYVNNLLSNKLNRMSVARPQLEFQMEVKDKDLKVGDIVYLNSNEFNNVDGTDYNSQKFQVIKKEPLGNKINFTIEKIVVEDTSIPSVETSVEKIKQRINKINPVTTKTISGEYEVTNLEYYDPDAGKWKSGENLTLDMHNEIKIRWDDIYNSSVPSLSLKKVGGSAVDVEQSQLKEHQEYILYKWVGDKGEDTPDYKYPTSSETKGDYIVIDRLPEEKRRNAAKYEYTYKLSEFDIGRYIALYVSASFSKVDKTPKIEERKSV